MKKCDFKDLAHHDHADFLEEAECMAEEAYEFIVNKMKEDIVKKLKSQKLVKSDDDLKRGWTGDVPKIEIDVNKKLDKVLEKYMLALKFFLLGDMAGVKARNAAKSTGLYNKFIPGVIFSAYFDSLDTHRKHYENLFGEEPKKLETKLVRDSMDAIQNKTDKFIDESLTKLRNRVVAGIEDEIDKYNHQNTYDVHSKAHDLKDQGKSEAIKEASKDIVSKMDVGEIKDVVQEAADNYKSNWNSMVQSDLSISSAVGTHQVVSEVYGSESEDIRVAFVAMRDEKTCNFCKDISRNTDGSLKLYKMEDFMPAGYNYGRKRKDWEKVVPPAHPHCRCNLVYVPKGFEIDKSGNVSPKAG